MLWGCPGPHATLDFYARRVGVAAQGGPPAAGQAARASRGPSGGVVASQVGGGEGEEEI